MNAHVATAVAQSNRNLADAVTTSVIEYRKQETGNQALASLYSAATLAILAYWGSGVDSVVKRPQQH